MNIYIIISCILDRCGEEIILLGLMVLFILSSFPITIAEKADFNNGTGFFRTEDFHHTEGL